MAKALLWRNTFLQKHLGERESYKMGTFSNQVQELLPEALSNLQFRACTSFDREHSILRTILESKRSAVHLENARSALCGKPVPAPLKCHRGTSVSTGDADARSGLIAPQKRTSNSRNVHHSG